MNVNTIYDEFLNKVVNIGIPNFYKKERLFFLTGLVINIENNFLVLKIKDGIRRIPFSDIIEISVNHMVD